MKVKSTVFELDVKIFVPEVYHDDRGFFTESFNDKLYNEIRSWHKRYKAFGPSDFYQDNHSKSHKNVLRGLHYQWRLPMGKLLRVVSGRGLDCVVDIRVNSETYGDYQTFELSEDNHNILWVPPGFAQGFLSLEDDTHLCYKTTAPYNGDCEGSIYPFDEDLDIDWGIDIDTIHLSEKDLHAQTFSEYRDKPIFDYDND